MSGFTQEHLDRLKRGEKRPGTERISAKDARHLFSGGTLPASEPAVPSSKLRNQVTTYDGCRYDSKAEANYARDLDLKVRAGLVTRWEKQISFELVVAGALICKYILDFRVHLPDGTVQHIDVKGQRSGAPYKIFRIKKKLMLALHGITVLEVKG